MFCVFYKHVQRNSQKNVCSLFPFYRRQAVPPRGAADAFRVEGIDDVAVVFATADGGKCARCWKVTPEVSEEDGICNRCEDVVNG